MKILDWVRLCLIAGVILGFYLMVTATWDYLEEQRGYTESAAVDVLRSIHSAEASRGSPITAQEMADELAFVYEAQTDAVRDRNDYRYRPSDGYWFALSPGRAHSFCMDKSGLLYVTSDADQVKTKFPVLAWRAYAPRTDKK